MGLGLTLSGLGLGFGLGLMPIWAVVASCVRRWQVERDGGGEASHWPVGDKPRAISATAAGHLLVTCSVRRQLRVFSDAGLLLRAVDLPDDVACPCAALQLPAAAASPSHSQHDRYLVFHASLTDNAYQLSVRTHRVCNSRKPPGIYKTLSYRRVTARCVMSVEILPVATQQCRNYLYH